jgi:5'-nucleotidase
MRPENRDGEGECYQVNSKVKAVYEDKRKKLVSLSVNGRQVEDDRFYTICLQGYHFNNCRSYLNVSQEELLKSGGAKIVTTSAFEMLKEHLRSNQNLKSAIEGRLTYL